MVYYRGLAELPGERLIDRYERCEELFRRGTRLQEAAMKTTAESVSEARLKQILDVMDDGVYVIREDLTVEYTNRAMSRFEEAGVDGPKCHRVIFGRDTVCPWCRAREVLDGQEVQWEHHVPEMGRTFHITESPIRNPDGSVSKLSVYRDVTRRKRREKTLETSREDTERLFEHVGAGVYISSKEGRFLKVNQALIDMLGYESKEECLSIDLAEDLYMHAEDRHEFQELIERDGRVIEYEVEDYEIISASDGFEAGLQVNHFRPHLLILDIMMPDIKGYDVCKKIKENEETRDTKIIVLSAYLDDEKFKKTKEYGADLCFSKPLPLPKLKAEVARLLVGAENSPTREEGVERNGNERGSP